MARMRFGKVQQVTCIQHVAATGQHDEPLCLAYKTTKTFFGGGVRLVDDGYVLGIEEGAREHVTSFLEIDAAETQRLQALQLIPRPLPPYQIPWLEYAAGYSLWVSLTLGLLYWSLATWLKRRRARQRKHEAATAPISFGPPVILTAADRFVRDQVGPLLQAGEVVQHQAYALSRAPGGSMVSAALTKAWFAVLTDRRLLLIETRVGAFGILLENRNVTALSRTQILSVTVEERFLGLALSDGKVKMLWVPITKKLSNQHPFYRDVPRILTPPPFATFD